MKQIQGRGAPRGALNGASKLSANEVREIRQRYIPFNNVGVLAKEFGINVKTVRSIVNGEIWGWLD